MKLTLIINQGEDNFLIGQIKEIPEVITQAKNKEELLENIYDALDLYLEDKRSKYELDAEGNVTEEELLFKI